MCDTQKLLMERVGNIMNISVVLGHIDFVRINESEDIEWIEFRNVSTLNFHISI